jgi:hypothetical protein
MEHLAYRLLACAPKVAQLSSGRGRPTAEEADDDELKPPGRLRPKHPNRRCTTSVITGVDSSPVEQSLMEPTLLYNSNRPNCVFWGSFKAALQTNGIAMRPAGTARQVVPSPGHARHPGIDALPPDWSTQPAERVLRLRRTYR